MKKILAVAIAAFAFNVLAAAPAAKHEAGDAKAADKKAKKDDKAAAAAPDAGTPAPAPAK